jgi:phosphoglycolate phosphatase
LKQPKPTIQAIIFDFDYTLADSSRGVIACFNFAFDRLGLPLADDALIRQTIGLSLPDALVMLGGKEYTRHTEEFTRLFIKRADEIMADNTQLFDTVPETTAALRDFGIQLGIFSLKYRYRIETVLKREALLDAFEVIIGAEDVSAHKPNPKGLLLAMERLNCVPQNCLYVGDSVTDAKTAQRTDIDFIAVLSGVTPRATFEDYDVYAILGDVSGLLNLEFLTGS